MKLVDYLNKSFPSVKLVPSIYYQWDIGIHFSLGKGNYQFNKNGELNLELFRIINKQASTIFNELFEPNDDLFLVTNFYKSKAKQKKIRKLKVYQPNLKCKNTLKRIQVRTHPYPLEIDEAEEYEMQQFSLLCKPADIRVNKILKAVSNKDFSLKPKFGGYSVHYPDVFFVNITKDIIFFIYDDRGCEVIARSAERLRPLYEKYYDWIEEVDRKRIEVGLGVPFIK